MDCLRSVERLPEIRVLADERRLAILQRLMAAPATLSQLGEAMGKHPAWIRHHLKRLEEVGLIELSGTRALPGFTEKYYRATARAFTVSRVVTPGLAGEGRLLVTGSHDLALELLARRYRELGPDRSMWIVPLGSLDGLIALRQGVGQCAGCHLLDSETGDYNLPYVERLFPGERMTLVTLTEREQGLVVAPGNPLALTGVVDLASRAVRFVNRQKGSGTRLWLDRAMKAAGMSPAAVAGYEAEVHTHSEVARAVANGEAQAGLGIKAAALAEGLGFVPLFSERFELVLRSDDWDLPEWQEAAGVLTNRAFLAEVEALGGYDLSRCGQIRVSE